VVRGEDRLIGQVGVVKRANPVDVAGDDVVDASSGVGRVGSHADDGLGDEVANEHPLCLRDCQWREVRGDAPGVLGDVGIELAGALDRDVRVVNESVFFVHDPDECGE